jgi:RNA 3'-terminal phosphate cyclase (ATP)
MGPQIDLMLEQHGFYPAGGGTIPSRYYALPEATRRPYRIARRGYLEASYGGCCESPGHIAKREIETVEHLFSSAIESQIVDTKMSLGPGNVVRIEIRRDAITEVFTAFDRLGVSAENVAKEAVQEAREYLVSNAVAGNTLRVNVVAVRAGCRRQFHCIEAYPACNHMEIIRLFLPVTFATVDGADHFEVSVRRV